MIEMEESSSPPPGAEDLESELQKPAEQETPEEQQVKEELKTEPLPAAQTPAPVPKEEKKKKQYHGVFDLFTPIDRFFPIRTASIKGSFLNLANSSSGGASFFSTQKMVGGYFFESDPRDYGFLKQFSGRIQYNRQLRNELTENSMTEWSANIRGVTFNYNRTVSRAGSQPNAAPYISVSDVRRTLIAYIGENGTSISYANDENISRVISASPAGASNRKQTWTLNTPIGGNRINLTLVHSDSSSRNHISGDAGYMLQTDARLVAPISSKFELNLGYQFLNNRGRPAAGGSYKKGKTTASVGLSYILTHDIKLTYSFNHTSNRDNSAGVYSKFNITNRDFKLDVPISPRALFSLGNTATLDRSSGKTLIRSWVFSYNHTAIKWFPGTTTIDVRKQFSNARDYGAVNYAWSVNTPLAIGSRSLNLSFKNALDELLCISTAERTRSHNQTFGIEANITSKFSIGTYLGRVKNTGTNRAVITGLAINNNRTDKATLGFSKFFGFRLPAMNSMRYSYSITTSSAQTHFPASALNSNRIRRHVFDFFFQGKSWNGKYAIERSFSIARPGQTQRSLLHKIEWSFEDIMGCRFTLNYTGAFQKSDVQHSGIFKLARKISDKTSFYGSYEFIRSRNKLDSMKNGRNRFFELGFEIVF